MILDTANRDVKDLVAKGILAPVQGCVRDVSYTLNYVKSDFQMRDFSDSTLISGDGKDYILSVYKGRKILEERITSLDKIRFKQNEISIDDLVYKYFAYLSE